MTTTIEQAGGRHAIRNDVGRQSAVRSRSVSISLSLVGLFTVAISAWGGIIPYLGPTFGYSADGAGSWEWNLTHSVLALVPGAIGVLIGLLLFTPVRTETVGRRRFGLGVAGTVAIACGAWFVVGPLAWPVITNVSHYFVPASPLRDLTNRVGYSFGPGVILAACGAFSIGWAARHNRPLEALGTRESESSRNGSMVPMAVAPAVVAPAAAVPSAAAPNVTPPNQGGFVPTHLTGAGEYPVGETPVMPPAPAGGAGEAGGVGGPVVP